MIQSNAESGAEILQTFTPDSQAVGITTPFGRMALARRENVTGQATDALVEGFIEGSGLRDTSYNTGERNAAPTPERNSNSNIAVIAIMAAIGFGLAVGFKEGA